MIGFQLTRRRLLTGLGAAGLLALAGTPFSASAAERPEEIVKLIYGSYDSGPTYKPPYMDDLAAKLSDAEAHPGFDFFIDAQDYDKVTADIALASENDAAAVVKVTATNFGKSRALEIDFRKVDNAWKVANVRYPGEQGFDLRDSVGLDPL